MNKPLIRRLKALVSQFSGKKVAVIGDVVLDEFVWGTVDRISPEAPVPVVEVTSETEHLGGAANVAQNLKALEADVDLIGVVGDDHAGRRFLKQLEKSKLGLSGIVADTERRTTIKTRVVAHHQQVCRTDRESKSPLGPKTRNALLSRAQTAIEDADSVILSDYAKGVLVADVAARLIEHAKSHGKFIAVDPKLNDFTAYRSASVITPNVKEAERASGIKVGDYEALLRAGQRILDETGAENLLITRGDQGMTLFEGKEYLNIPTFAREVFDVTGAGDTVIATLALAIGAGATVREASFLANCAAGIVVGKFGTASVSTRELYTSIDGTPQIDSQ